MEENLVIDHKTGSYARSNHSDLIYLKITLSNFYKCNNTLITVSGLNAIYTVFNTIGIKKDWESFNLIHPSELYYETNILILNYKKKYIPLNIYKFDICKTESIIQLFSKELYQKDNVLFLESCSNPNGYIFDFRIIKQLRELSKKLLVIVDNTWCPHYIFNPFNYDVDIVVTSLTKYYSAGKVIGGVCFFKEYDLYNIAESEHIINGNYVNPVTAQILNNEILDMEERVLSSSKLILNVIKILNNSYNLKKNIKIIHPSIQCHPSYELSKIFFNKNNFDNSILYPSVFSYNTKISKKKLLFVLQNNNILDHMTSFGTKMTRTDLYPIEINGITTGRISIGYNDDLNRIIKGINEIFKKILT
jgi:cystathionine beta-lyase/cystathionine gamma-synthase